MRGPKILNVIGIPLLLLVNLGCSDSTTQGPHGSNVFYAEENQDGNSVRQKRSPPNETGIAALEGIRDLNVVGFYVALRELYLTGGFAKSLTFNSAILREGVIPDFIYHETIRSLEQTRWEIKRGDVSLERIRGMIELNKPSALIHEPWLIQLALEILEKSKNPKNVAYSIRDLGVYLLKENLPREGYLNGTILRNSINQWLSVELKNEPTNWTEPLLMLHHTIGPENFNLLGDILESMPWQTEGMYVPDAEFIRFYNYRLNEAIADADVAIRILDRIHSGYVNVTNNSKDSIINRLAHSEIVSSSTDTPIFNGGTVPPVDGGAEMNRHEKSMEEMSKIWMEITNEQAKTRFVEVAKRALDSKIGGLEGVKQAMIAGARLIKNLGGSVENANKKCQEVIKMAEKDVMASNRFDNAIQILLKLSKGTPQAYQVLFDQFFKKPLENRFLFQGSKYQSLESMLKFFDDINLGEGSGFKEIIKFLGKKKPSLETFNRLVSTLSDDGKLVKNLQKHFGNYQISLENAEKIRKALQSIQGISKSDWELLENIRTIREIFNVDQNYISMLSTISKSARDGIWLDVYDSFENLYSMTAGPSGSAQIRMAPFNGLSEMIGSDGSYQEVFLAMQSLLDDRTTMRQKCKFLEDFYTGLEDIPSVVEAFGVKTEEIRRNVEATISNDALIQLLRASESRDGLGRLLAYHGGYTTKDDPNESISMIADMIVYLGQNGWR